MALDKKHLSCSEIMPGVPLLSSASGYAPHLVCWLRGPIKQLVKLSHIITCFMHRVKWGPCCVLDIYLDI